MGMHKIWKIVGPFVLSPPSVFIDIMSSSRPSLSLSPQLRSIVSSTAKAWMMNTRHKNTFMLVIECECEEKKKAGKRFPNKFMIINPEWDANL